MRIVIDIDGDNVQVHTERDSDRQLSGSNLSEVVDAGSPPADLLQRQSRGKGGVKSYREDTPLNPLRAGQAVARRQLAQALEPAIEPGEPVDAGRAPKLPGTSRRKKGSSTAKQRRRKK
jgi:hypothetical protein